MKRAQASQKFAAAADQFQNLVYEQADSLAAPRKRSISRSRSRPSSRGRRRRRSPRAIPNSWQALFSPESIQSKRNTEAMEIGPNVLIAARILEYKPAAPRPFDDVKDEVRRQLVHKAATEMAQSAGRAKLRSLDEGKRDKEAGVTFGKPVLVGRNQPQSRIPAGSRDAIFQVNPDKLPAYVGATNERGDYSIYKVLSVSTPATTDKSKIDAASARLGEQIGREMSTAYLATLKAKADVKINQANLEKK